MTSGQGWSVVVPLKALDRSKSRLHLPADRKRALVVAMARDVRDAVLSAAQVAEMVVVTSDRRWHGLLAAPGLRFVADEPTDSLNQALRRGVAACRTAGPGCQVAALTGDLPALRPAELEEALAQVPAAATSFVPDAEGSGTTLYAAGSQARFWPEYGEGSRARHLRGGAWEISLPEQAGIRRDVDTADDLRAAMSLRLGPHTRAVVSAIAGARSPIGSRVVEGSPVPAVAAPGLVFIG